MNNTAKVILFTSAILGGSVFTGIKWYQHRADQFIHSAIEKLRNAPGSGEIERIHLPSGESCSVVMEHSCCSGAGYDAVVILASNGNAYTSKKNYCGIEGFYGELPSENFSNLSDLDTYLRKEGYELKSAPEAGGNG